MGRLYTLIFFILMGLMAVSCDKEEVYVYDQQLVLEREAPLIASYITANRLSDSAKLHQETGIWYILSDSGSTAVDYLAVDSITNKVELKNKLVRVKYTARMLDSTLFEENLLLDSIPYEPLLTSETDTGRILAWKIAFYPKSVGGLLEGGLRIGAKIRIITPSVYAYQDRPYGILKENSPLDYELEVLDIKEAEKPATIQKN